MLKVLIADDERISREIISLLLANQPEIESIEQVSDGQQVLQKVQSSRPDILFLDIQMPGKTGIEVAELLDPAIVVVFVTAYDEYAITAFELDATDYLLKPFEDKRFYAAWERAKGKVVNRVESDFAQLASVNLPNQQEKEQTHKDCLLIKEPGRIRFIEVEQINFIAGAGNYAELHLFDAKVVLHRETLCTLEEQLDPNKFIRIHRSTIVRRSSIQELRPNEKGDYLVLLKSGDTLTLSRRNKSKLHNLLN